MYDPWTVRPISWSPPDGPSPVSYMTPSGGRVWTSYSYSGPTHSSWRENPFWVCHGAPIIFGYSLGIFVTLVRLCARMTKGQLGWDDAAAGCAAVLSIYLIVMSAIVRQASYYFEWESGVFQVLAGWGTLYIHDIIMWMTRLSVVWTVLRLMPSEQRSRVPKFVWFGILAVWPLIAFQELFICGSHINLHPKCDIPSVFAGVMQLITSIWGTAWPLMIPIYYFLKKDLTTSQFICMLEATSTQLGILAPAIATFVFILQQDEVGVRVTWHIQVPLAIVACNLPALVSMFILDNKPAIQLGPETREALVGGDVENAGAAPQPTQGSQ